MSHIYQRGTVSPEINMTPLIDVTFLLIIFFMLVNNIIAEETVEMVVPKLSESQSVEVGDIKRLVINIRPAAYDGSRLRGGNFLRYAGGGEALEVQVGQGKHFDLSEMDELVEELVKSKEAAADEGERIEILLRADGALRYDQIEPVIGAVSRAGIGVLNLVAFLPNEGPAGDGLAKEGVGDGE